MRKATIIQATSEKIVPGGQSLATLADGKKAFVWGVLPQEDFTFTVTKNKAHYCEGLVQDVLKASPKRIAARDTCFLSTSPWQIFDYDYELAQKSQLVVSAFRQQGIEITPPPILSDGKNFYYRNKMEYSLYYDHDDQQIHLAFHQRGSHRKIPITQSSIERPEVFQEATRILKELNLAQADARQYQSLLVRCSQDGQVSSALLEKFKAHPKMSNLEDQLLGRRFSYSPNGFFQINLPLYEMALKHIQQRLKSNKVLDFYAGVGSIGLSVAADRELTLVEINPAAYQELLTNCQNLTNQDPSNHITPVFAKSESTTNYLTPHHDVILDPPRAGCDDRLISALNEIKPAQILYLSCNPITQARDLAKLLQNYHLSDITLFNFFPRTPHIESLITLQRRLN